VKKNIDILVIPIATPILIGIYEDNKLIETISQDGKTSDILPNIFQTLLSKYNILNIYYTNGPGSYMAIKIGYIFLKTISITKKINFQAASGFKFNNNSPIKALGKKYFFNSNNDKIEIKFLGELDTVETFKLPNILDKDIFSDDCLPNYNLPAVN